MENKLMISAGKGGVGKTTVSTSIACYLSGEAEMTGLIDYDGGHSVQNTLCFPNTIVPNTVTKVQEKLLAVIIDTKQYIGIGKTQSAGMSIGNYLAQFPGHLGIVPFADMVSEFFGVPTDTVTLQKFAFLIQSIIELEEKGCEHIIIDVEPTAGLERLLTNADSMIRSLRRLKDKGIVFLSLIAAKWPDIASYLKGDYIKKIDVYAQKIEEVVRAVRNAKYFLITTPEKGPVQQTFEVRTIIQNFGGCATCCIVNNVRGESHEAMVLEKLKLHALPIIKIPRMNGFHEEFDFKKRLLQLAEAGKRAYGSFHQAEIIN